MQINSIFVFVTEYSSDEFVLNKSRIEINIFCTSIVVDEVFKSSSQTRFNTLNNKISLTYVY